MKLISRSVAQFEILYNLAIGGNLSDICVALEAYVFLHTDRNATEEKWNIYGLMTANESSPADFPCICWAGPPDAENKAVTNNQLTPHPRLCIMLCMEG